MNGQAKKIALMGILGALGFLVMLAAIPWPLAGFLKIDLSEVIVLFGFFAGGPSVGIAVAVLKSLLQFLIQGSTTGGVGELTAIIASLSYAFPVWFIYKKLTGTKGVILSLVIGSLVGTLTLSVVMVVLNYFWITPFFARLNEIGFILDMMDDKPVYTKWVVSIYGPFNFIKGVIISIVYGIIHMRLKNSRLMELDD